MDLGQRKTYQAFDNENEDVTWIQFDGNGDLTTMNDAYLMLLDQIYGPNHIFRKSFGCQNIHA
jgi:hypothetical protein